MFELGRLVRIQIIGFFKGKHWQVAVADICGEKRFVSGKQHVYTAQKLLRKRDKVNNL